MIWVTAALGMAIGAGYYLVALCATAFILLVFVHLYALEGWIDRVNQIRTYKIVCHFESETLAPVRSAVQKPSSEIQAKQPAKIGGNLMTGEWVVQGSERNHRHFIHASAP